MSISHSLPSSVFLSVLCGINGLTSALTAAPPSEPPSSTLHIIRPTGFEISDRTLKRAGLDYWNKLEVFYYDSYADFLDKVGPDAPLFFFSSKGKRCYTEAEYPDGAYIVFGCETRGLPAELIEENLHRTYRLPMRETLRCLNLSNAVAIVTYEVLRSWDFEGLV